MTEPMTADASATRGFFVDMIVRDIDVNGAILDLIDNAVDAAYAESQTGGLSSYTIELKLDAHKFSISDNCGGMTVETARAYAFRFGRAPDFHPKSRIGQFGIGMKRAIFRLGNHFLVRSATESEQFSIEVDVSRWRQEDGDWGFPMRIDDNQGEQSGTIVEVTELKPNVSEQFSRTAYLDQLRNDIKDRYTEALAEGLGITVNQEPVETRLHTLMVGTLIRAENRAQDLYSNGDLVTMKSYVGIGPERRPASESGWYVYCNGRLVVRADRTSATGWGTDPPDGPDIQAWHNQYLRFRGYVFFVSDNPAALPWSTTKNELDRSSPIYLQSLEYMQSMIRLYATFTNELGAERRHAEEGEDDEPAPPTRIQDAMDHAAQVTLDRIGVGSFGVPKRETEPLPARPTGPQTSSVQFNALTSHLSELKRVLKLRSNRQVGEAAFARLYEEELG